MAAAAAANKNLNMTELWLAREDRCSRELVRELGLVPGVYQEFSRLWIIEDVQKIVSKWIREVAVTREEKGEPNYCAETAYYGSYGLQVHSPRSDLDVIIIGPSFATLQHDFLVRLYDLVRADLPNAIDVHCIPGAKVPLIRFKLYGVSVDMCYARLGLKTIPKAHEIQFFTLTPLDPSGKLAWSSFLMNVTLSNAIPDGNPSERFRLGLRLIKFWSLKRCISGNVIGYMGGVHWTVLLAYTCMRYPRKPLIQLLSSFFWDFFVWEWPTPVLFGRTVSTPRNLLMPIQKPGSTEFLHSNVNHATMDRITSELSRAAFITQGMESICDLSLPECRLFESFNYKESYTNFLKIRISLPDGNDDTGALDRLVGLAQSRFPDLIKKLEAQELDCDPTMTEYRDCGKGMNKVFLWGVISETRGNRILSAVEQSWADHLRGCGGLESDFNIYLAIIPVDTNSRYIALH